MSKEILIFSDAHLGYRQYGLKQRELDFERAFEFVVDAAISKGIKTMVHGGDLFHSKRLTSRTLDFMWDQHEKLMAAGVKLLTISGNHDYSEPSWFKMFSRRNPDLTGIVGIDGDQADEAGVVIVGRADASDLEDLEGTILVLHTPLLEFAQYPSDNILEAKDLPTANFKLIVVGDTHVSKEVVVDECTVLSPGSTEMNSTSEPITKNYYIAKFNDGELDLTAHTIGTRPVVELNIKTAEDVDDAVILLKEASNLKPFIIGKYDADLPEALLRLKAAVNLDEVVMRLDVVREGSVVATVTNNEMLRPLQDYVGDILEPDDTIYSLAIDLASNSEGVDIINNYIDNRL